MRKVAIIMCVLFLGALFTAQVFAGGKAADLKNKKVQTSQGEELGMVEDVVTGSDGQVKYIIISQIGAPADEMTPVPYNQVQTVEEDIIILAVDKDTLAEAPTISKDQYGELNKPEMDKKVHGYFGEGVESQMKEGATGMMKEGQEKAKGMKQE